MSIKAKFRRLIKALSLQRAAEYELVLLRRETRQEIAKRVRQWEQQCVEYRRHREKLRQQHRIKSNKKTG